MTLIRCVPTLARPRGDNPSDAEWARFLAGALETVLEGGAHDGPCGGSPCPEHIAASLARGDFARNALLGYQAAHRSPEDLVE